MKIHWDKLNKKQRERWREVLLCLDRNEWKYDKAAEEMGVPSKELSSVLYKMRQAGVVEGRFICGFMAEQIRRGNVRLGDYRKDFRLQEFEFQRWLVDQIPDKSVSILNVLIGMAYDVYLEETGAEESAQNKAA